MQRATTAAGIRPPTNSEPIDTLEVIEPSSSIAMLGGMVSLIAAGDREHRRALFLKRIALLAQHIPHLPAPTAATSADLRTGETGDQVHARDQHLQHAAPRKCSRSVFGIEAHQS